MSGWQRKTVLITGASAGLGLAIAEQFARVQANVVMVARNAERLEVEAEILRKSVRGAYEIHTIVGDVTEPDSVNQIVSETIEQFSQLDVLVNNVGVSSRGRLLDVTPEQHRHSWELNFLTAVRCTQACAPHLVASQGHLVNIASLAAKTAPPFIGPYAVSKFPLAAFSQSLRFEMKADGVHILLVCPGPLAREDAGNRYDDQSGDIPEHAKLPGGGAKLKGLDPHEVAKKIIHACERRKPELVLPAKARLLFMLSAVSPKWGDWLLAKMTKSGNRS